MAMQELHNENFVCVVPEKHLPEIALLQKYNPKLV